MTPAKPRPHVTVLPSKSMEPVSHTTSSPDVQKRRRSVTSAADGSHHVEIVIATRAGQHADKSDSRKGCNNAPLPCAVDRSGGGRRRSPIGNEMPKERNPRRRNVGSPRPPAKNLIHDAVRESNRGGQRRPSGCYDDGDAPGSSQAKAAEFKFGDNQVGGALLARLSELGVHAPWFVDAKRLHSTDVRADQNRLQFPGTSPLSRAFTDAEIARARASNGVQVAVLDRRGHEYEMTCKLWTGDKHFRFMGEGWKNFRDAHHLSIAKEARLTRRVTVELWAFRSRALPPMPPPKGKDGGDDEEPRRHPDGALGLVVLVRDDVEEQGEVARQEVLAPPPAESYVSRFLLIMAAVALLTLRTRDGTKRKRDD